MIVPAISKQGILVTPERREVTTRGSPGTFLLEILMWYSASFPSSYVKGIKLHTLSTYLISELRTDFGHHLTPFPALKGNETPSAQRSQARSHLDRVSFTSPNKSLFCPLVCQPSFHSDITV